MEKIIYISEIESDDENIEYCEYSVTYNFDSEYDDEHCERLVDAEAFADEVNDHNGGDCKIVKPSA